MPHLHTEPGQHDHTVSAYIVRLGTPEPTLVLHRAISYSTSCCSSAVILN